MDMASDHGASKEPTNPYSTVDASVPLMHHDPSDLGSFRIQKSGLGFSHRNAPLGS